MRYRRLYTNGAAYFFTLATYKRQKILSDSNNIQLLKRSIAIIKSKYPFVIEAIVVLPEHLHCLLTLPHKDHDFSTRLRLIKTGFSKKCNTRNQLLFPIEQSRRLKKEKHIWQRRFWEHQIRNEKDFNAHMDYIHYNPVKHGLVQSPKDWPYSSFISCVNKGFYDIDWGATITNTYFDNINNAE
jgi:putative transposase